MKHLLAALATLMFAASPALAETVGMLSPAQQDVIARSIERLSSPEERELASSWSEAKKVAEFVCRPIALAALQSWNSSADRVFLGTDDPDTLRLESERLLTGSGEVRTGSDWVSFEFTCELDPASGEALSFATDLTSRGE